MMKSLLILIWLTTTTTGLLAHGSQAPSSATLQTRRWHRNGPRSALSMTRAGAVLRRKPITPPPVQQQDVLTLNPPVSLDESSPVDTAAVDIPPGEASIPAEVFNLVKTIVGAAVLGLPAGIVAFGNAPSAILPALVLISAVALLSSTSFSMIGLVCSRTRATSYRQAWETTVGTASWIPPAATLLVTCCSTLTYSMVLRATVPDLIQAATGLVVTPTAALLGITLTTLLPLCLAKQLRALAPFSLVGIMGMVYTVGVMVVRWLSGAYAATGSMGATLTASQLPQFGTLGWQSVFSGNAAILVSMLSTAFMAHYNAPKLYWELQNNTMERFNKVVRFGYFGAFLLKALTATAGFLTFGAAAQRIILNNYAVTDSFMSLSRLAITLSLLCSYPLTFVAVREGVFDLGRVTLKQREKLSSLVSVILLSSITAMTFVVKDIRTIIAFGGSTWGNWLTYVFPAMMVVTLSRQKGQEDLKKSHVPRAYLTGILGVCLSIVGTIRAVQSM